jgi:hypothetical protein
MKIILEEIGEAICNEVRKCNLSAGVNYIDSHVEMTEYNVLFKGRIGLNIDFSCYACLFEKMQVQYEDCRVIHLSINQVEEIENYLINQTF